MSNPATELRNYAVTPADHNAVTARQAMSEPLISNVSDTARWMAAYRATETARPDALFDDPFADTLAGDRGPAIAAAAPRLLRSGWWWVIRTKLIDDLIAEAVKSGCDRVLNLATGFDARPYRLDLPAGLEWIEADLPELINEKQQLLAGATPRCQLSRVAVDLADARSRAAFLADATSGARNAVVITEGLLLYLSEQQVGSLADDLRRSEIGAWITDLIAPVIVRGMMRRMPSLEKAPMTFEPTDGVAFFERRDWSVGTVRTIHRHAGRWNRLPTVMRPLACIPDLNPRKLAYLPWSGVVRFDR